MGPQPYYQVFFRLTEGYLRGLELNACRVTVLNFALDALRAVIY